MQNRKKVLEPQWALIGSIFLEAPTKPESDKIRSSLTFTIAKESIRDRVTG